VRGRRSTASDVGLVNMPEYPLVLTKFLLRARDFFPGKEIVSYGDEVVRYTYADYAQRVHRLAGALTELGVGRGDRVATFAWNHHRHLELYFAVPAVGAVLHTLNIRLSQDDIGYILDHAGDRVVFVDESLLPQIRPVLDARPAIKVVVMRDRPGDGPDGYPGYEELLARARPVTEFPPTAEEELAVLCYTSGTTGRPKGVPYTHRTLFLHTFAACLADGHAISERDTVLHVVPMFHANAWGVPFAATMVGAKQVLPGARPTPERIAELIEREGVTYTGMVPTVAADLLRHVKETGRRVSTLRALVLGGSPPSPALVRELEQVLKVPVYQGWGMTELSPMASYGRITAGEDDGAADITQGRLLPGLEWKLLDDADRELPWDGTSRGELVIRGPWAATRYYRDESPESFWNGWLRTGDIATIDPAGRLRIVDRKKDLIKSGGEWISPADLEAALLEHPEVGEAAVVGVQHPRWQERPVALVVPREGHRVDEEALRRSLADRFARWWQPDRILVVDELPRTGVGKIDKRALRRRYARILLDERPG